ncbi:hypothetical protein C7S18_20670 [Ahniella affigens]|uniref:Uncharacterized protein n=1 Tax=Ahniella affigens TaxID=2021234 RepID=A0A2P1PXA3_9GAMM|nr:hypothetical protein C7S18_20670 [Ahniella affigens]
MSKQNGGETEMAQAAAGLRGKVAQVTSAALGMPIPRQPRARPTAVGRLGVDTNTRHARLHGLASRRLGPALAPEVQPLGADTGERELLSGDGRPDCEPASRPGRALPTLGCRGAATASKTDRLKHRC